jgi:hypothetical protein
MLLEVSFSLHYQFDIPFNRGLTGRDILKVAAKLS